MNDKEFEKNYYNIEDLKSYMKVPVGKKLDFIAEMNAFLGSFKSEQTKKMEEKIRQDDW